MGTDMYTAIKETLNDKVKQIASPVYGMSMNVRKDVAILINAADQAAADYCTKVRQHPGIRAAVRKFSSDEEMERFLDDVCTRAQESENPILLRKFYLFIASDPAYVLHASFDDYRDVLRELEYDLLLLTKKMDVYPSVSGYMRYLLASPKDPDSGRVLILDASVSQPAFSPSLLGFPESSGWFSMRTKEYSSIKEEICEQIYKDLSPQMQAESYRVIIGKLENLEKQFVRLVSNLQGQARSYPLARELPLVGYGEMQSHFAGLFPRQFAFGGYSGGGKPRGTGWSVGQALSVLFGMEQGVCRTEKLRELLGRNVLLQVCRNAIRENRSYLTAQLEIFTLQDLYSYGGIISKISGRSAFYQAKADNLDHQLKQYIHSNEFLISSVDPAGLYKGLDIYFKKWEEYLNLCIWKEWWKGFAEFVGEIIGEHAEEYQTLTDICQMCKDNITYDNIEEGSRTSIRSVNDVFNMINKLAPVSTYSQEELMKLIQRETRLVIELKGDQGNLRLRPRMCLFGSSSVLKKTSKISLDLEWLLQPVDFVSESTAYIVRMYAVRTEG